MVGGRGSAGPCAPRAVLADRPRGELVAISLSVVLLLAIVLIVMIRGGSIKAGPAVVAALFGFFLASSGVGPTISKVLNEIGTSISKINF
jgi:hypothetical protein